MSRTLTAIVLLALAAAASRAADAKAPPPEPKVHRGLAYGEPKNKLQTLDIFAPAEGKNHPVVVYVHGGGWHSGDKAEVHNKPKALTGRGFVLASVNYRRNSALTWGTDLGLKEELGTDLGH